MLRFKNKVVVITGAGRGIGKCLAESFAAQGARVALISRSINSCGTASEEINNTFGAETSKAYALDVSDSEAALETGKKIISDFGGVNVLINNAGVTRDGLLMRMKDEDWDTVLNTNLKGAFNMVKALQRPLMKSQDPRILNIASVIGLIGNAGQANYAASKAGLIGFTKSIAKELSGRQVCCNVIAPGFITTDMTDALDESLREGILSNIPLKEFGKPSDIAELALFLASDSARYITGQVIACDGGMTM